MDIYTPIFQKVADITKYINNESDSLMIDIMVNDAIAAARSSSVMVAISPLAFPGERRLVGVVKDILKSRNFRVSEVEGVLCLKW